MAKVLTNSDIKNAVIAQLSEIYGSEDAIPKEALYHSIEGDNLCSAVETVRKGFTLDTMYPTVPIKYLSTVTIQEVLTGRMVVTGIKLTPHKINVRFFLGSGSNATPIKVAIVNQNGKLVSRTSQTVPWGGNAVLPTDSQIAEVLKGTGLTFRGWNRNYENIRNYTSATYEGTVNAEYFYDIRMLTEIKSPGVGDLITLNWLESITYKESSDGSYYSTIATLSDPANNGVYTVSNDGATFSVAASCNTVNTLFGRMRLYTRGEGLAVNAIATNPVHLNLENNRLVVTRADYESNILYVSSRFGISSKMYCNYSNKNNYLYKTTERWMATIGNGSGDHYVTTYLNLDYGSPNDSTFIDAVKDGTLPIDNYYNCNFGEVLAEGVIINDLSWTVKIDNTTQPINYQIESSPCGSTCIKTEYVFDPYCEGVLVGDYGDTGPISWKNDSKLKEFENHSYVTDSNGNTMVSGTKMTPGKRYDIHILFPEGEDTLPLIGDTSEYKVSIWATFKIGIYQNGKLSTMLAPPILTNELVTYLPSNEESDAAHKRGPNTQASGTWSVDLNTSGIKSTAYKNADDLSTLPRNEDGKNMFSIGVYIFERMS